MGMNVENNKSFEDMASEMEANETVENTEATEEVTDQKDAE